MSEATSHQAASLLTLPALAARLQQQLTEAPDEAFAFHIKDARGAGAPLSALAIARHCRRPIVYVTADAEAAEAAALDLRHLATDPCLAVMLGDGATSVDLLLPSDRSPFEDVHPDRRASMKRLATLTALAEGKPWHTLVTTASALVRRVLPPQPLAEASFSISRGEAIDLGDLVTRLVSVGYLRTPVVEDPGCLAVRGGLIDVWPAGAKRPTRIELSGDTVTSLRPFDPDSQRTDVEVGALWLPPATELLLGDDVRRRSTERLRQLCDTANFPSGKTRQLLEDLQDRRSLSGAEGYLPACYPLVPLWQYLSGSCLVVVEDPAACVNALRATLKEAERSFEAHANRPRFPVDELFVSIDEVTEWLLSRPLLAAHADSVSRSGPAEGLSSLELSPLDTPSLGFDDHAELQRTLKQRRKDSGQGALTPLLKRITQWHDGGLRVHFSARTDTQARRLAALLRDRDLAVSLPADGDRADANLTVTVGTLSRGVVAETLALVVVTEEEVFGRRAHRAREVKRSPRAALEDLRALAPGDHVVHVEHGIGRYLGLTNQRVGTGASVDLLQVEYRGGDKLFVPVYRMNQIQKLSGGEANPNLDRLGGLTFARTKAKVKRKVYEMADELLALYAERASRKRDPLPAMDSDYLAFEAAFPFEETPDQASAIGDIMGDLDGAQVMDRLVCGDVGFGKTEVALRAAFRQVMAGKQVALLCPTTILANQHYQTVERRFADHPISVGVLSRFSTKAAQTKVALDLRSGSLDVVVGTHRLLSRDVHFKRLGMLIVDEEQRFGVVAKERIKQLKKDVDVLTLSATPIPRTLQLAFGGLQDLSVIATPPVDRRTVRTVTARYDDALVKEVIERELSRGGQVFYVYNRVEGINERATRVQALIPGARVVVAHGQMSATALERTMLGFVRGDHDVLVATSIVESGLDIPRANTLIVDRADLFGLAQLYQLRGRVGRSSERAYCYLLVPAPNRLTDEARTRVDALTRYTALGSGLQIAELDLELRGAGNFLGSAQSGSVRSVGFDLFCQMLEEATLELQGQEVKSEVDPEISIDIEALLPEDYVSEVGVRLSLYKRLASAGEEADVVQLAIEIEDRFGRPPTVARSLFELMALKARLRQLRVLSCEASARAVTLHLRDDTPVDSATLARLAVEQPDVYRLRPGGQIMRRATERERSPGGLALAATLLAEIAP